MFHLLPSKYSFRLVGRQELKEFKKTKTAEINSAESFDNQNQDQIDQKRRSFLRVLGVIGASAVGLSIFPKKADALGLGGAPISNSVNLRNRSNVKINPATEEGTAVLKKSVVLTSSGTILTPTTGKKIRLYNTKFSLSADMTSVSFRFGIGGDDFEKYLAPKTGGLYGIKNHPNYVEGTADAILYCAITGTGSVQVNVDYVEFP